MSEQLRQHGGGFVPGHAAGQSGTRQAHGGGFVSGSRQTTSGPSTPRSPQSSQPQYAPIQRQYQPPAQPMAVQAHGISPAGSRHNSSGSDIEEKKDPRVFVAEVRGNDNIPVRNVPIAAAEVGQINNIPARRPAHVEVAEIDEYNGVLTERRATVHLKGILHYSDPRTKWRWKKPSLYQQPALEYNDHHRTYRHRDAKDRVSEFTMDDRYLSPDDGHLAKLYAQATDYIYEQGGTVTWRRTYIRSVAPWSYRIATWPIDSEIDPQSWKDWSIIILKFIPASLALTFVIFGGNTPTLHYAGGYAPFAYRFHGYPKAARNQLEDARTTRSNRPNESDDRTKARILRPRYLCFLKNPKDDFLHGVDRMRVTDWQEENHTDKILRYLFVAYSTEHFSHQSNEDLEALWKIAEKAARDAKLPAFWVACSCMPDLDQLEDDVYRISDIIRGAAELVIAVGTSSQGKAKEVPHLPASTDDLLREWGRRMWTFPEILLSPKDSVKVYTRSQKAESPPHLVPKNQFAAEYWTGDAHVSRQLLDHYAGNLVLSRLELVVLALQCLESRQTTQYMHGDHAYALMGLLRMRPKVDRTDSAFQAFARLSLSNDSDLLLERLICLMPKSPDQPWYNMDDAYGSSLWDIYPQCQIAGVGYDDTVIIDGAYATSIRWESFHRIRAIRRDSWSRTLAWKFLHLTSIFVLVGFILIGVGGQSAGGSGQSAGGSGSYTGYNFAVEPTVISGSGGSGGPVSPGLVGVGVFFLFVGISGWFMAPRLLRKHLGGKFWDTQAAVFGFEGYLDLGTIERSIFGGNFGRFNWSTNGSPLSRHVKNEFRECVGVDPTGDIKVRNLVVDSTRTARLGEQRIFTLVDTYSMTITLFQAARPPTALVVCASEGGMKRAIGCSYDWTTGTLYRETVLRMPTTVLNRMDRAERLKFGLKRPSVPTSPKIAN